jgi:RNA polymerase sigma-70 factor (ECF subfamily)
MERDPETVLDELLVLQAQGGDADALAAIVRRWQGRLARHAFHLLGSAEDATDVVQETWLAVVRGINGLDDPACFPRWVFSIVSRKCADCIRHWQRDRMLVTGLASNRPAPATPVTESELVHLRAGLQRLGGERRALLSMAYLDGLSIIEIATVLGVPPGTVKSRLYHARQELKEMLERSNHE